MLSRNVASPDWREGTVKGHGEILKVIRRGDQDAAAELITEHISFAYERILQSYLDSMSDSADAAETGTVASTPLTTGKRPPI
jgi:DNA-binding GntR family transcriptional regulator